MSRSWGTSPNNDENGEMYCAERNGAEEKGADAYGANNDGANNDGAEKEHGTSLKMLNLNVCGLVSRLSDDIFIEECKLYDILCFSETKMNDIDNELVANIFKEMGFVTYIKNRRKISIHRSGGILIACKIMFKDYITDCTTPSQVVKWLRLGCTITGYNHDILLGAIYIPPRQSVYSNVEMFTDLENELLNLRTNNEFVLLCGDFNAHTGIVNEVVNFDDVHGFDGEEIIINNRANRDRCKKDVYGDKLVDFCRTTDMCIFNGRIGNDKDVGKETTVKNTVVDYFIGSPHLTRHIYNLDVHPFDPLFSDIHKKMVLSFELVQAVNSLEVVEQSKDEGEICIGRWKSEKACNFINSLNDDVIQSIVNDVEEGHDLSVANVNNKLKTVLLDAAKMSLSYKKKTRKKEYKHGYSKSCKDAKAEYYKSKNVYRKTPNKCNLDNLRAKSKVYKKAVKKHKDESHKQFISHLKNLKGNDPKMYWNIINAKKKGDVKASVQSLYDHFKELSDKVDDIENDINESQNLNLDVSSLNCIITADEIVKLAKKLKNNKAAGIDQIKNEYIKFSMDKMLPIYVYLFNKVLDSGTIPDDWSMGLIVPVYKKQGSEQDPNNYRGITLLSCVGKLFTMLINERLHTFLECNNLLSENQAGFRKSYSTLDHIFLLKCIIDLCKFKKQKLFCAFIDYQKAFDTVWRDGLWYKLYTQNGVEGKLLNVIKNMYTNIKSCVFVNGVKSDSFCSMIGVRQGENLSPLLFSLFVNDIEDYLLDSGGKVLDFKDDNMNNYLKLFVLMYADDTVILSNTAKDLQNALDNLKLYCNRWKLKVNPTKTKVTIFGSRKVKAGKYEFMYDGKSVDIVDSFKYLGVIFNFNGKFDLCKKNLKRARL
jgi:exonuclease III